MEYPFNGIAHPKNNFGHYLLTHMLSQTCINLFLVLNTKYDISKNVGNQTVAGPHLIVAKNHIEVTVDQQLFGFTHFFKIAFMFSRRKKLTQV